MAKTKISEFSTTAGNNTDINSINIAEGCAPSGINDAIRELMRQLKEFQTGGAGDSVNSGGDFSVATNKFTVASASGNTAVAGTLGVTGAATLSSTLAVTGTTTLTGALVANGNATLGDGSGDTVTVKGTPTLEVNPTLSGGTANGVLYLNGSKVATSGSALTFDGAQLGVNGVTVGRGAGAVSSNTVVGSNALSSGSQSGSSNTAIGRGTLTSNTTGYNNTAIGDNSLNATTVGSSNTGVGVYSLSLNISGVQNSAVGYGALYNNTTGSYNTAHGYQSLTSNTTASNNTAVGYQAAYSNTTGDSITAFGAGAMFSNTTGSRGQAFGYAALNKNTTGDYNSAFGYASLFNNTTGVRNAAFAYNSMGSNTSGSYNTAFGMDALQANTTASNNTVVGYQAGYSNQTGEENHYTGYRAGYAAIGSYNTFVGSLCAYNQTSGDLNTFVGRAAGYYMTNGAKNTILGSYTGNQYGLDIRTASNYIVLSDGDGNPRLIADGSGNWLTGSKRSAVQSGQGCIFYGTGQSSGAYITGDGGPAMYVNRETSDGTIIDIRRAASTVGSISVTTTATAYNTSSDYRLKNTIAPMTGALAKVALLKPCTYKWNSDGSNGQGFIAHELAEVVPECVSGEKDAVDDDGNPKYQGIDTSFLVATLTAAIQELKSELDSVKAELATLKGN